MDVEEKCCSTTNSLTADKSKVSPKKQLRAAEIIISESETSNVSSHAISTPSSNSDVESSKKSVKSLRSAVYLNEDSDILPDHYNH